MPFDPPRLYAITDVAISGLSHLEQLRRFVDAGATLVQLREKNAMPGDWFDDAAACASYARENGITLIVNDRVDIAIAINADGVHLGQDDLPVQAARELLGDESIIGLSTHTLDQVRSALDQSIDYIGFGPIFPTTTKANPDQVTGIELLREARAIAGSLPIVAIGGITLANARDIIAAGAASVAIISDLLAGPNHITEAARSLQQRLSLD